MLRCGNSTDDCCVFSGVLHRNRAFSGVRARTPDADDTSVGAPLNRRAALRVVAPAAGRGNESPDRG